MRQIQIKSNGKNLPVTSSAVQYSSVLGRLQHLMVGVHSDLSLSRQRERKQAGHPQGCCWGGGNNISIQFSVKSIWFYFLALIDISFTVDLINYKS